MLDPHVQRLDIAGFAVVCSLGETYAIRETLPEARKAQTEAEQYLHEAECCGHSMAARWVAERLPFAVIVLTAEERALREEDGTPVLDREP